MDSSDQSLETKGEYDLTFLPDNDTGDDHFDAEEYILEDKEGDSLTPSLFVQHVDVLWRVTEGNVDQTSKLSEDLSSSEIRPVDCGTINELTGVFQESENHEIANSMSMVAEELVNDMLDRECEVTQAYQEKYEDCVDVFGDETAVATIVSTIIHEEDGISLDFVRTLLVQKSPIESKTVSARVDDDEASNALHLAIKLSALSEEKDQLERNIKSVLKDLEVE